MKNFFISYTSSDEKWAEWIAFVLEEAGFSTVIQAWDFRPGGNFVLEMQKASHAAERTIMILSPAYLESQFAAPEWSAAFRKDPQGSKRTLVPVKVERCDPEGMLPAVIAIDLVGCDEPTARAKLLGGVDEKRAKPTERPAFPGKAAAPKEFPGAAKGSKQSAGSTDDRRRYVPAVKVPASDVEKRRFLRAAFAAAQQHIESGLEQLSHQDHVDVDFQNVTTNEFTAEIFLQGKSVARTRIWIGGLTANDGIAVAEGNQHHGQNSYNEILSVAEHEGTLCLSAMMQGFGRIEASYDLRRLSAEEAADYLWRRLVAPLEHAR